MAYSVLVVDDEVNIRKTLEGVLSDEGYRVMLAETGEAALEAIPKTLVDAVLLDVWLPGMDGLDVVVAARRIRPDIPIILMTGYAVEERVQEALARKASSCLRKPFQIAELETALQATL
jgi:two-component system nitrogen regulation response regulator NtrX